MDSDPGASKRIAAVDVGSNAMRMVIAELAHDGRIVALKSERFPVRLGQASLGVNVT